MLDPLSYEGARGQSSDLGWHTFTHVPGAAVLSA